MVPKQSEIEILQSSCFRAVLFRMVPKLNPDMNVIRYGFRAVLFRMVPKPLAGLYFKDICFRAVLFRMVPKRSRL